MHQYTSISNMALSCTPENCRRDGELDRTEFARSIAGNLSLSFS